MLVDESQRIFATPDSAAASAADSASRPATPVFILPEPSETANPIIRNHQRRALNLEISSLISRKRPRGESPSSSSERGDDDDEPTNGRGINGVLSRRDMPRQYLLRPNFNVVFQHVSIDKYSDYYHAALYNAKRYLKASELELQARSQSHVISAGALRECMQDTPDDMQMDAYSSEMRSDKDSIKGRLDRATAAVSRDRPWYC